MARRLSRAGRLAAATLLLLSALALLAPLLANDAPLLVIWRGHLIIPALQTVSATRFLPESPPIAADYHDPVLRAAIRAHGTIIWPPDPHGPFKPAWSAGPAPAPPSATTPLGTDPAGRDVLAEFLYGLRGALTFGAATAAAAGLLGAIAGSLQGYFGGLTDLLGQRLIEIWNFLPALFLLIVLATTIGTSLPLLFALVVALSWTGLVPSVRAAALRSRRLEHVRAARALGLPPATILRRHILPDATAPIAAFLPFTAAGTITLLATLAFLGFAPTGTDAGLLGRLAAEARTHLEAPWLVATAILGLFLPLAALAALGADLRAQADPHRK